jgi:hypothetical protein
MGIMSFPRPRGEHPRLGKILATWSATAALHQWETPATDEEIAAAEAAIGEPLLPELRALYEMSDGLYLLEGNLNILPLCDLVKRSDELLRWNWPIPAELRVFGDNGAGDLFGLWLPPGRSTERAVPVITVGGVFKPRCMAIAGTDLARFLTTRTAYYLMVCECESEALDLLEVPMSLRTDVPGDETFAALTRWADPGLADPNPDPYQRGLDAEELRKRYGCSPL